MLTTSLIAGIKHANSENISGLKRRSATCSKGNGSAVDSIPTAIQQSKTQLLCQPAAISAEPISGTVNKAQESGQKSCLLCPSFDPLRAVSLQIARGDRRWASQ